MGVGVENLIGNADILLESYLGSGGLSGVMKKYAKNGPRKVQNRLKWFILIEFTRVVADF